MRERKGEMGIQSGVTSVAIYRKKLERERKERPRQILLLISTGVLFIIIVVG